MQSKFDINMSLPGVKICVTKMCITAFYNFRYRLKKHFKKFPTVNEARENKHEEVKTQAEWDFLCDRFSSEEFQVLMFTVYSFLFQKGIIPN